MTHSDKTITKITDKVTTGFHSLDEVIDSLRMGDNVVFQVNHIDVYRRFASAFVSSHSAPERRLIYVRFAHHAPIIDANDFVHIYEIDAEDGFETFSTQIHEIISAEGRDVFYVFDSLSDLLDSWATDSMIGNFFKITCPYLYELNTVAYFATLRNKNSFQTNAAIRDTTQVLLDVYETSEQTYVHPLKVWNRYSPTMFLPHVIYDHKILPVTSSGDATTLLAKIYKTENPERHLDYWDRMFLKASEQYYSSKLSSSQEREWIEQLCKFILSRDEQFLSLLKEYFTLEDLLGIKSRLLGSGYIGGKALGMLLARKILIKQNKEWRQRLEPHDSFYIGSDVYYSFLVENGLWKLKMEQRQPKNYFNTAKIIKNKILQGKFNDRIKNEFLRMLEYFGQAPIIVRSSSLLEDGFGNAFAGKYESVFCINQGTLEQRYAIFEEAVLNVFASTMNEDALTYRLKRGLSEKDEQMALLIQRVSGSHKQNYFFPDVAGVGFSHNTYVWEKNMDPKAGMARLVSGLGTRAVDRLEGDYARTVALDKPLLKPYDGLQSFKKYSQSKMDILNITKNQLESLPLKDLIKNRVDINLPLLAERDWEAERKMKELRLQTMESWVFSFDPLLSETDFSPTLQRLLKILETVYDYPVDIEFTVNFKENNTYEINLLQCRPLQVQGIKSRVEFPNHLETQKIFFQSTGHFMGGNIAKEIQQVIYVDPKAYYSLNESQKYEVARSIGKLNRLITKDHTSVMLLGPGRWGTSTPSLGVPVMFSEINNMSILIELGYSDIGYAPELSYGTHFFQDLVESEIFYIALFPERKEVLFQVQALKRKAQNDSPLAFNPEISNALHVYNLQENRSNLQLVSDILEQRILCFFN